MAETTAPSNSKCSPFSSGRGVSRPLLRTMISGVVFACLIKAVPTPPVFNPAPPLTLTLEKSNPVEELYYVAWLPAHAPPYVVSRGPHMSG